MIFLNKEEPSVISIDKDIVVDYKRESDLYLINIKRSLTRQLVFYGVYTGLNKLNNSFYKIISGLLNDEYKDMQTFRDDYKAFSVTCSEFIKECENYVDDDVLESVSYEVNCVDLIIKKLIAIVENFCVSEDFR